MQTIDRRLARRRRRGVTLVEMLIVVAIMSLVAAGVAVAAAKFWANAQEKTTRTNARTVRTGIQGYQLSESSAACPSFDELVASGHLDEGADRNDPWGNPYSIECDGSHVSVSSAGPDGKPDTEDDIRVPERRKDETGT